MHSGVTGCPVTPFFYFMDKKSKIFITLWILLILTPFVGLSKMTPQIDVFMNQTLSAEWIHVVAHFMIFSVLGFFFPKTLFRQKNILRQYVLSMLLLLTIAMLQEIFQLMIKARGFDLNELFDLGVDLGSGTIGFIVFVILRKFKKNEINE